MRKQKTDARDAALLLELLLSGRFPRLWRPTMEVRDLRHKTLKQEQVHGRDWRDLDALRAELTTFFDITYNHQRLHSALNYQTPAAFEQQLRSGAKAETSTEMTGARELTAPSPQTPLPGLQSFSQENCP